MNIAAGLLSGALVEGTGTRRPSPSKDEMILLCASLLGLAIADLVKAEVAACTAETTLASAADSQKCPTVTPTSSLHSVGYDKAGDRNLLLGDEELRRNLLENVPMRASTGHPSER